MSTLLSLERSVVLLIWVCFCFFCVFFFFPFCLVRWVVLFCPLSPPHLRFMKLENLKDCCVFVNNKTIVHSVLVNVPCPNCYFRSPSARGCGQFLMSPCPQCERVGRDPVLGARPSHFNHETPLVRVRSALCRHLQAQPRGLVLAAFVRGQTGSFSWPASF